MLNSPCTVTSLYQVSTSLLQANKAAAQQAAEPVEADAAHKEAAAEGVANPSQDDTPPRQQPFGEAAQAGTDSSTEPAEHQTPAVPADEQQAAPDNAALSGPAGDAATQAATGSQPGRDMHASSLMSTSQETEAAAGEAALPPSQLPWQFSQARHCFKQ